MTDGVAASLLALGPRSLWRAHACYSLLSCDVQLGQRVAAMGICEQQYGQGFVVGAAGAGAGPRSLLNCCTSRNTANATIRKLMIVFRKTP